METLTIKGTPHQNTADKSKTRFSSWVIRVDVPRNATSFAWCRQVELEVFVQIFTNILNAHMQIALRRGDNFMAHRLFYLIYVGAPAVQVGAEGKGIDTQGGIRAAGADFSGGLSGWGRST